VRRKRACPVGPMTAESDGCEAAGRKASGFLSTTPALTRAEGAQRLERRVQRIVMLIFTMLLHGNDHVPLDLQTLGEPVI
jgi:hypothetical protein